ncbi:MAG: tyrosine-type recombinase/integrase [Thiotrichales bacterium]|jgi:integrase|nr:tyrosine-type recombinase/integrase [Thiotrichales bacterium]
MGLPKYVGISKGRYIYRPYNTDTKKKGKEIVLCTVDKSIAEVWSRYEQVTIIEVKKTLRWAISQYLASGDFDALGELSKQDYLKHSKQIVNTPMLSGLIFGDIMFEQITTGALQKYHDKRSKKAPVTANKEIGFLSVVYNWHKRRDNVRNNPATGIKKNSTKPRDRYVTDNEYNAFIAIAYASGSRYIAPMMEIAYLCRARRIEIINMKKDDIGTEGLMLRRAKGSKTQIIGWTDRLKTAVNILVDQSEKINSQWLVHDRDGQQINDSSFETAWHRLQQKYKESGMTGFTFHDLKAKGVSDFDGDKLKASGHKTTAMLNVYDRTLDTVIATK